MRGTEKWRSLKVRESQYEALAECSEYTGRPIIQLASEALTWFIREMVPIYIDHAERARISIQGRVQAKPRRKPAGRRKKASTGTKRGEIETVTMAS